MYYIISPKPIDYLKKFKIPYKENSSTRDSMAFYNTDEGKEFLKISPLIISRAPNLKEGAYQAAIDISFISLCYNCTLYIYAMKDNYYYNNLELGFSGYRNLGKLSKLTDSNIDKSIDVNKLKIPMDTTYFKGNIDTIIQSMSESFKDIKFSRNPCYTFRITPKSGIKNITK